MPTTFANMTKLWIQALFLMYCNSMPLETKNKTKYKFQIPSASSWNISARCTVELPKCVVLRCLYVKINIGASPWKETGVRVCACVYACACMHTLGEGGKAGRETANAFVLWVEMLKCINSLANARGLQPDATWNNGCMDRALKRNFIFKSVLYWH